MPGQERITVQRRSEMNSKHSPVQVKLVGIPSFKCKLLTQCKWVVREVKFTVEMLGKGCNTVDQYRAMNTV